MKRKIFLAMIAIVVVIAVGYNVYISQNDVNLSDLALDNVEALAGGESGGHGCVKAAYEWDDDWHEDSKFFMKCKAGCPEGEGTKPRYTDC